ncbi:unnamed protein product [Closterium sp. NIES-65]|nr:unnamed protein product [Closterium sp. NIES-65]
MSGIQSDASLPSLASDARPRLTWTDKEDCLLKELIRQHGTNKWALVASKIRTKTNKQCRRRWQAFLNAMGNKGVWTPEEDEKLLEGHRLYGNRWTEIARMVPGRTDNAAKNRAVGAFRDAAADDASAAGGIDELWRKAELRAVTAEVAESEARVKALEAERDAREARVARASERCRQAEVSIQQATSAVHVARHAQYSLRAAEWAAAVGVREGVAAAEEGRRRLNQLLMLAGSESGRGGNETKSITLGGMLMLEGSEAAAGTRDGLLHGKQQQEASCGAEEQGEQGGAEGRGERGAEGGGRLEGRPLDTLHALKALQMAARDLTAASFAMADRGLGLGAVEEHVKTFFSLLRLPLPSPTPPLPADGSKGRDLFALQLPLQQGKGSLCIAASFAAREGISLHCSFLCSKGRDLFALQLPLQQGKGSLCIAASFAARGGISLHCSFLCSKGRDLFALQLPLQQGKGSLSAKDLSAASFAVSDRGVDLGAVEEHVLSINKKWLSYLKMQRSVLNENAVD